LRTPRSLRRRYAESARCMAPCQELTAPHQRQRPATSLVRSLPASRYLAPAPDARQPDWHDHYQQHGTSRQRRYPAFLHDPIIPSANVLAKRLECVKLASALPDTRPRDAHCAGTGRSLSRRLRFAPAATPRLAASHDHSQRDRTRIAFGVREACFRFSSRQPMSATIPFAESQLLSARPTARSISSA
jgi:hypothetical protein